MHGFRMMILFLMLVTSLTPSLLTFTLTRSFKLKSKYACNISIDSLSNMSEIDIVEKSDQQLNNEKNDRKQMKQNVIIGNTALQNMIDMTNYQIPPISSDVVFSKWAKETVARRYS